MNFTYVRNERLVFAFTHWLEAKFCWSVIVNQNTSEHYRIRHWSYQLPNSNNRVIPPKYEQTLNYIYAACNSNINEKQYCWFRLDAKTHRLNRACNRKSYFYVWITLANVTMVNNFQWRSFMIFPIHFASWPPNTDYCPVLIEK